MIAHKPTSLVCAIQENKLYAFKETFGMLVIIGKWFLKLSNIFMLIKQKNLSLLKDAAHVNFGKLKFIKNGKSTIRFHFNRSQVMTSASNKKKF